MIPNVYCLCGSKMCGFLLQSARIDDSNQVVFTSGTGAEQQEPDATPRIRFQIESVDENIEPLSPDVIWPPRDDENDDRVLTADAVPMTAYYRGNESSHGRVRPSLVDLHEGYFMQLTQATEEVVRLCICVCLGCCVLF